MIELSELLSDAKDPIVTAHERGCSDSSCDVGGGRMHLTLLQALSRNNTCARNGKSRRRYRQRHFSDLAPLPGHVSNHVPAPQAEFRRLLEQARDLPIAA
jgi:hypothetical protein